MNDHVTLLINLIVVFAFPAAGGLCYMGYMRSLRGEIPSQSEDALREIGLWKESDGLSPAAYYVAAVIILLVAGLLKLWSPQLV